LFCIILLCFFTFRVPCCDVCYDFSLKRCLVSFYLQLFVGGLIYAICVYLHIVVSNIYYVVFLFCFLRIVYPILPVSLDCPPLIVLSIFSNVYLIYHNLYFVICFTIQICTRINLNIRWYPFCITVLRRMWLMQQELLTLSEAPKFIPIFIGARIALFAFFLHSQWLTMVCRFVIFIVVSLHCLSFFALRLLISPLVYSYFS
jgi:hypothetical protein